MEEANEHVNESKLKMSSVHPEECGKTGSEKEKKDKKSWKSSLISWWIADKKRSKHRAEPTNNTESKVYGKRKDPIYNINCGKGAPTMNMNMKERRPTCGLLTVTNLFSKSTKREEIPFPYLSLHQQNSPPAVQIYGPLYVVT